MDGPCSDQFPQPTGPKPYYDLAQEALLPGENLSEVFHHPEIPPTEPKPSYDLAWEALLPGENHSQECQHPEILPTEPKPSFDWDGEALLPGEYLYQEYRHPEILQLPASSQATSNYDADFEFQVPQHAVPYQFHGERISLSPSSGKTPKREREVVDELVVILMECMGEVNTRSREALLKKFFTEIERDERLERFILERLRQSKVRAIGELCEKLPESGGQDRVSSVGGDGAMANNDEFYYVSTRGLTESVEDSSLKLDRFKVKTPDLGVMIEEDKKC